MKTQMIKKNSGFTLVETLFAVFILTFVIVGLMTVVANSLFTARYARDEITANYLLQEVVDYVRNDRDTKVFLNSGAWVDFYNDYSSCLGSDGCSFDVLAPTIQGCPINDGCPYLYYDKDANTSSFYAEDNGSGEKTKFQRKIVVGQNGGDEIIVTVTVYWKNGGIDRSRTLTTSLTNWQK